VTAFLKVDADTCVAHSPIERRARIAGARFERRGGWNVAVGYGDPAVERGWLRHTVGFTDRSQLRKLELHERSRAAALGDAIRAPDGAWWCPVTPLRTLVLGGDGPMPDGAVDLTCGHAALELKGPVSNELLARFCAIDVRASVMPVGAFRPGSVARTPGYVLRTAGDALLVLVGWALGEYMWELVADAAAHLGGGPVGVDS
jgi:glycine cleavage system aminomethyltransferase T